MRFSGRTKTLDRTKSTKSTASKPAAIAASAFTSSIHAAASFTYTTRTVATATLAAASVVTAGAMYRNRYMEQRVARAVGMCEGCKRDEKCFTKT